MTIIDLFALLGISSILLSCARALSARMSDNRSAPKFILRLVHVLGFVSFLGYFANPFETYLNNCAYDQMMKRVRAARYLAELITYPPDYMCDQYGFDYPSQEDRADLKLYYEDLNETQEFYVANKLYPPSVLYDNKPLDKFKDWRNHEYKKLGL